MSWCDATNCVRPMPSCSTLRVLKAHMEDDMQAGIAITNTDHTVDDIRAGPGARVPEGATAPASPQGGSAGAGGFPAEFQRTGDARPAGGRGSGIRRQLVRRRGAHWPERHARPRLGVAWQAGLGCQGTIAAAIAICSARSARMTPRRSWTSAPRFPTVVKRRRCSTAQAGIGHGHVSHPMPRPAY